MDITATSIPEVKIIKPRVHGDDRGFFTETWRADSFAAAGIGPEFVQDNHSRSRRGVLRGMHYQVRQPQGKLVRVIAGEVYDAAVDMRRSSATFGRWTGVLLSAENRRQLWVPEGFAHGFLVLSESADFVYKCTSYYSPEDERCLRWNDPRVGVGWPLDRIGKPLLSDRDAAAASFAEAEYFD